MVTAMATSGYVCRVGKEWKIGPCESVVVEKRGARKLLK